jgi:hypothetical protein
MVDIAEDALENALTIFDYLNSLNSQIRHVGNAEDDFRNSVAEMDMDYRNQLIEIFGTPYEGTIGSGKAYPAGYQGPDIYYYNYIDLNEISNQTVPAPNEKITALFQPGNVIYTQNSRLDTAFTDIDLAYAHFLPQDFPDGYSVHGIM